MIKDDKIAEDAYFDMDEEYFEKNGKASYINKDIISIGFPEDENNQQYSGLGLILLW